MSTPPLNLPALADDIVARVNQALAGSGIEYVSGVVTPDPTVPVHEYFTTEAATIDGVEYDAEQAVVLFRVQGSWVHKVVALPRLPTVTFLGSHHGADTTAATTFSFASSGVTTEAGLLVACMGVENNNPASVSVGGLSAPQVMGTSGWSNPSPCMYAVAVDAGHGLDVEVTLPYARNWAAVDLLLITGVDMVPYAIVSPNHSSHNGAYAPDAPEGSIVVSHLVIRRGNGTLVPTVEWSTPMIEESNQAFLANYSSGDPRVGSSIETSTAWGRHPGAGDFRLSPLTTQLVATAIFRKADV